MLRSKLLQPGNNHVILFRAMATKLKDYVSHYDVLEVSPEGTKVRRVLGKLYSLINVYITD